MTFERLLSIVPKYNGIGSPVEWLYKLEAGIEITKTKHSGILPFIILFFTEDAFIWYSTILDYQMFEDFDSFRVSFIEFFNPPQEKVLDCLANCFFDTKNSFKDYIFMLGRNFSKLNYLMDDVAKVQWFVRGLSKNWQLHFISKNFTVYKEVCYYALSLDSRPSNEDPPLFPDTEQGLKDVNNLESTCGAQNKASKDSLINDVVSNIAASQVDQRPHTFLDSEYIVEPLELSNSNYPIKSIANNDLSKPLDLYSSKDEHYIPSDATISSSSLDSSQRDIENHLSYRSLTLGCIVQGCQAFAIFYPLNFKPSISEKCFLRLLQNGCKVELKSSNDTQSFSSLEDNSLGEDRSIVLGSTKIDLIFNDFIKIKVSLIVIRNQSSDILLGNKFMKLNDILLDFPLRRVKFLSTPSGPTAAFPALLRNGITF